MTRHGTAGFIVGGFLLIGLASASGQSGGRPEAPRSGACFYEHPNFGGRSVCAGVGESVRMVPSNMNDRISSVRVFGDAEVTVFKDRDFRGDSRRFGRDRNDLREAGWNDRISSFRVGERPFREGVRWGHPETPRSGACFFEDPNFHGRSFCASVGDTVAMVPEGMNDKVSSIRIFGDAEVIVFKDRDYRGDSRSFGRDMEDLRAAGFNDRISSFEVGERRSSHHRH